MESSTGSDPNHYKFTGKERDSESGLDDFGARYYLSRLGSFMQPDPEQISGFSHMLDPQGWNGYSYVRNSPTVFVDPHGAIYEDCGDHTLFRGNGHICGQNQSGADPGYRQDDGNSDAENQKKWWWRAAHALGFVSTAQESAAYDAFLEYVGRHPEKFRVNKGIVFPIGPLSEAASRAAELASAMGKTKDFVTIAVTETEEGVTVISSSENALRPAVNAVLKDGEVAVEGAGHAETTGVNAANQMGLNPTGTAASRGICQGCADFLRQAGVRALSWFKNGVVP